MILIYFLLLPALAYGRMAVLINITPESKFADAIGHFTNDISDVEREIFKIEDKDLKAAVAKYSGETPVAVYVNDTSASGLYKTHNWLDMKRTVRPDLKINVTETCDATGSLENITNTVAVSWSGAKISVAEDLEYEISVFDHIVKFNSSWGKNMNLTEPVKLDTPTEVKKCSLTVDIKYVAKLSGDLAVDFGKKCKGYYRWAFDIANVQARAGLPKTADVIQTIKLSYYQKVSAS